MLTIDERTASLMQALDGGAGPAVFQRQLRTAMQEVARDQQTACANAVLEACNHATRYKVRGETIYQAVLAAELK